jgi:hypothetical protein
MFNCMKLCDSSSIRYSSFVIAAAFDIQRTMSPVPWAVLCRSITRNQQMTTHDVHENND